MWGVYVIIVLRTVHPILGNIQANTSIARLRHSEAALFERLKMISVIPTTIYLVARLTLLTLALLSLRDLHGPALQTVAWTTYIPHI